MPRHPHEPVTPMLPFPPMPPAPPCGCVPPRMRPEPFSPGGLPAPHGFDFGKWVREKIGWLMSLVPSEADADNQLADKAWVEQQTGELGNGKADKVDGATAGNLAGLDSEGNLTDSGAKPDDFVGKAALFDNPDASPTVKSSLLPSYVDDVVEYASLSAFPATGESGKIYVALDTNIQYRWSGTQYTEIAKIIVPSTSAPLVDGAASAGSSEAYSRGDHRHPTDTSRASVADATLTALTGFSDWALDVPGGYTVVAGPNFIPEPDPSAPPGTGEWRITVAGGIYGGGSDVDGNHANEPNATEVVFGLAGGVAITAARTVLQGYRLGPDDPSNPNRDKPLASEAEAEALRAGKADRPAAFAAGNLAEFDARGNPTDSGKKPGDFQSALSQTQLDNIAAVPNKQDTLTFDTTPTAGSLNPVTSGGIRSAIDAATPGDYAQVKAQVQANTGDIADIKAVVPRVATAQNPLVDTTAMNSSIATNTANFLGTYSYVTDLGFPQPSSAADVDNAAIATALGGLAFAHTPTNNDYAFVSVNYAPTTDVDEFRRFKYNDTTETWAYEYTLNNSSFTAAQWAAINSGITGGDVTKLAGIAAGAQVNVIEGVKVNGTALTPDNKVVDVVAMSADATGADIPVDASAGAQKISAALAGKASDNAVVHTTGDEDVGGVKTFDPEGVVVYNPQTGFSMKLLDTGFAVTDGSNTVYFYVPSIAGGGGTFALLSDVTDKADRDESATPGNLAEFDSQGNPVDRGKSAADFMPADAKINELYNVNLNGAVDGDGQVFGSTTTGNTFNNGSTVYKFLDTETEYQVVGGVSTPFTKYRYKRDGADDIHYYRSYTGELVAPNGYAQAVFTPGKNPIAGDVLVRTASYGGNWSFVPAEITMSTTPSDFLARVSDLAAFSTAKSYAAGDIAGYDGKAYKCTTAHTGAWDASHFTPATKAEVQAYLAGIVASISGKQDALTFDSTPTAGSTNPVTSGGVKTAIDNIKVQRVYNAGGTDALDDKGQLFKSSQSGNYFMQSGTWQYVFVGEGRDSAYGDYYNYQMGGSYLHYFPESGDLRDDGRNLRAYCTPHLNPTVPGTDLAPQQIAGQATYTFTPLAATMETTPYAHFSLESLPDRTWAAGVWAVGDLVKYSDKAYRCKADATSSSTTAPSSDTTHWEEIPVLAQKADALSAQQLANIAAVPNKANASDIPYALGTPTIITSASPETVEGETVNYGAATLANRTQNQVAVLVALDELRVAIPPAVSGKVRDFGLIVGVGLGEGTALAAPALVPVAPTGETIAMMNAEGEMPTLADGTATASGATVLYFTEVADGTFLVKGEQIQGVA